MTQSTRNGDLRIEPLITDDLTSVASLQPEGWGEILPSIQYYCSSSFCFPLKASLNGTMVGMGTAIIYGKTAWLAHIIVHKEHRRIGIGSSITRSLISLVQKTGCRTILLIATSLGEPVYTRFDFRVQSQYIFFDPGVLTGARISHILPFHSEYQDAILELDFAVSGEDRRKLLMEHSSEINVITDGRRIRAFYIPTLGEGLIVANDAEAGIEFMKLKYTRNKNFCIPIDNVAGTSFLVQHGFKENRKASRMILGDDITWQGRKLYGRIGGNLG